MRFSLPTVVLAASLLSDSSLVAAWPVASDITGLSLQKAHNALFRRGNSVTGGPANRGNNQQSGRNGRNSNGDSGSDDDVEMLEGSDESGDTELEYKTDVRHLQLLSGVQALLFYGSLRQPLTCQRDLGRQ